MTSATTDRRIGLTGDKGYKAPVQAATTANIILSGEQTIDGVALVAVNASGVPDRVLVKNQTSSVDNGIWDVSTGSWTRSIDCNTTQDLVNGTQALVTGGTAQANQIFAITATNPINPGVSAITFTPTINLIFKNSIGRVVNSIAQLKTLDKTLYTQAFVTGYYASGDGGGGPYYYDASDTTSADNGGTIIVASDGGRWKLVITEGVGLSVKQFGAKGDGVTLDDTAFSNIRAFYEINANFRGGKIHAPKGHYKLSAAWGFTAYAAGTVHNIFIIGDGPDNTVLDWTGSAGGTNGITFNAGSHFGVEDIALVGAPGINLLINNGSLGTSNYCNYFHIRNVRMQSAGSDNFRSFNCYMGEIANCWSFGAGGIGYTFGAFHTSMKVSRCEASANTGAGWSLNGMIYSDFSCCGSDSNGTRGWSMSNMNAVTFNGCGAEQNQTDAFCLLTSTASTTGVPTAAQDIHGVVFNGCYATGNSAASAGTYGSFITAATADARGIDFVITGGRAVPNGATDVALILAGTSGTINVSKDRFYDSTFTALDSISGTVRVKNFSATGSLTLATLSAATQSITNNALTTLSLSTSASYNDLGVSISSNQMIIPRGVSKVRVSANIDFDANVTGVRQVFLLKNGVNIIGQASLTANAAAAGDTLLSVSSPVMVVSPTDYFTCQVYQNSGGALNVVQGTGTFMCVEAVC